jgi:hypothetical protein
MKPSTHLISALLLVLAATVGAAAAPRPAAPPAELAAAVQGSWVLNEAYRIRLSRSGRGLRVHQEVMRLGRRVVRDEPVQYEEASGLLRFQGVGAIHRLVVTLRRNGTGLDFAFSSEISPGEWIFGVWQQARRPSR